MQQDITQDVQYHLQQIQKQQLARLASSGEPFIPPVDNAPKSEPFKVGLDGVSTPSINVTAPGKQFMRDVKFCILGYAPSTTPLPPNATDPAKRVSNMVRFLTEHGGAIYLDKLPPNPTSVDIIAVHRTYRS